MTSVPAVTPEDASREMSAASKTIEELKRKRLDDEEQENADDDDDEVLDAVDDDATQSEGMHDEMKAGPTMTPAAAAAAAAAAVGMINGAHDVNGEKRVQLYDSKRMSRVSFNSWYDFDTYFEMYMQETFQPFRMRSSCSVEAYRRNQQKVMGQNKNSRGKRIEFPDSAVHHHRIYMCTHAMKARCRGAATRPGQKYRGIGCIAKINVKISPSDNQSKYMVIVTDQVTLSFVYHFGVRGECSMDFFYLLMQVVTHNHPISRDIYESYPDVLLKTMRRNQLTATMLTRQPSPKFEHPVQNQKYDKVMNLLHTLAEAMARLPEDEFDAQFNQLQKFYANAITDNAHV